MKAVIKRFPTTDLLAAAAADDVIATAQEAVRQRGRFTMAISGGSTPTALYTMLASPGFSGRMAWEQTHVFWADERCVPPDHPESNYRMAWETMLGYVPIPVDNIHRLRGELPPEQAAQEYEEFLRNFFPGVVMPRFDLVLLGMGEDGHTASLFPHTTAVQETTRWVVANFVEQRAAWRLTLTAPVINAAARVMFLIEGEQKARALQLVLAGTYDPDTLPAQLIHPTDGELEFLVDDAAASLLQIT